RNTRSSDARMNAPATNPVKNGYRTIRTLHCSSTSLGYMNPSVNGTRSSLSHRAVKAVVVELGLRCQVRLQHLNFVCPQKLVNGVLGVLEVGQLPRAGGAVLAAGRGQSLGDPVITKRAFLRHVFLRMQEAAAVRTCLYAVTAAQAVLFVDQHYAVRRDERSSHRTNLGAGRIRAVVAHFGNEELLHAGFVTAGESVLAAIGRINLKRFHAVDFLDAIALDPGAIVAVRRSEEHTSE